MSETYPTRTEMDNTEIALIFRALFYAISCIAVGRKTDDLLFQLCDAAERRERVAARIAPEPTTNETMQNDILDMLRALGLSDHARPASPHRVVQDEILPAIRRLPVAALTSLSRRSKA